MTTKKNKRVFAGFYRRFDYAYIQVLTVVDDVDTGSKVVFFKYDDIKHADGKNYAMTIESFCEDVEFNGKMTPKFTRCTRRARDEYYRRQLDDMGFNIPRSHKKKYVSKDMVIRECRQCTSYENYAKDICCYYNEDVNRFNKSVQAKRWVGVLGANEFKALKEDINFFHDCLNTSLKDYYPLFKKRYIEGLSIRKCAEEFGVSRGSIEYKEKKFLAELAMLLKQRDVNDGIIRIQECS